MSLVLSLAPARHVFERNVLQYRMLWVTFVAGFVEPVFYLFGLGLGLGGLIGTVQWQGEAVEYALFVAPGLIAASAMNGAVFDSTFNFFYKLRYAKTFDAMLTTPLTLATVVVGEVGWAMMRAGIYAAAFLVIAAVMGLIASWWALLIVPASLLIGVAFSSVGVAAASLLKSWHDFDYIALIVQPLFLASTTFFPLAVFPDWAHPIVLATPLYHGVSLCRALTLGTVGWADLGHVAYLVAMTGIGVLWARRRLETLLLS